MSFADIITPRTPHLLGQSGYATIQRDYEDLFASRAGVEQATPVPGKARPKPSNGGQRTANALRPGTLDAMVGQERLRKLLRRVIDNATVKGQTLDHCLLVGASGTGKSTIANIIGNELGVDVYQAEAPVSSATLLEYAEVMRDGDVLFVDEIHLQAAGGIAKSASTEPEVFFHLLEDKVILTPQGPVPFPDVCVIGATTDEGMLPDPFCNRFPLRPVIAQYTDEDLAEMAVRNAEALGLTIDNEAAGRFAVAARYQPRVLNNYVRNAESLVGVNRHVDPDIAKEVLYDLNGVTDDGLTRDMQAMLAFLLRSRKERASGEVLYAASLSTISTAIGKSRDVRGVTLRVEPYLILAGFVQITGAGRTLTPDGVDRALNL